MNKFWKFFYPLAVFTASFYSYVATIPRTIYLGDNAEFITAGATLGIPHPSGYPLYVLLAKLFSFFPVSTVAFRINLLSAVCGSAGLVVFYFILAKLLRWYQARGTKLIGFGELISPLSAVVSLLFGFTPLFWSQSNMAEVYSLNFLFFVTLVWLLLGLYETKSVKYFIWAAFAYGLGLANHEMMILLLPFFLAAASLSHANLRKRDWFFGVVVFAAGLGVYLYLPFRSSMTPVLDWGNTGASAHNFINHVLRLGYSDFGTGLSWIDKIRYLYDFFGESWVQFGVLLPWALFGIFVMARINARLCITFIGLAAGNVLGIILLRKASYSLEGGIIYSEYYLTTFSLLSIAIGLGIVGVWEFLSLRFIKINKFFPILLLAVAIIAVGRYSETFKINSLQDFTFLENYSHDLLSTLPSRAVVLVSLEGSATDSVTFSLLYQQAVRNLRPDVTIVGLPQVFKTPDYKALDKIMRASPLDEQRRELVNYAIAKKEFADRPIFTTFLTEDLDIKGVWHSLSNGLAYMFIPGSVTSSKVPQVKPILSPRDEAILKQTLYGQGLLSKYYLAQAASIAQTGDLAGSQEFYLKSIALDDNPEGFDVRSYQAHRAWVIPVKSK